MKNTTFYRSIALSGLLLFGAYSTYVVQTNPPQKIEIPLVSGQITEKMEIPYMCPDEIGKCVSYYMVVNNEQRLVNYETFNSKFVGDYIQLVKNEEIYIKYWNFYLLFSIIFLIIMVLSIVFVVSAHLVWALMYSDQYKYREFMRF